MKLRPIYALASVIAIVNLACEASLDTTCQGGDLTCDSHEPGNNSQGGSGGIGGGGGEAPYVAPADCYDTCDTLNGLGMTGEYPCAVESVIANCQRCHSANPTATPTGPFPWDTYADSQEELFTSGLARWARLVGVVENDFMPFDALKLTNSEKTVLIDDWACLCAPPRPAGETCN